MNGVTGKLFTEWGKLREWADRRETLSVLIGSKSSRRCSGGRFTTATAVEVTALKVRKCVNSDSKEHLKKDCPLLQKKKTQEKQEKLDWGARWRTKSGKCDTEMNKALITRLSNTSGWWVLDLGALGDMCNDKTQFEFLNYM